MNIDVATCLNCVYFAYIALIKSIKCIPRMYWVGRNNRKRNPRNLKKKNTSKNQNKKYQVSPFGNLHTHSHVLYNQFVIQFKCLFQHLHLNKVFNDSFHSFIFFFFMLKSEFWFSQSWPLGLQTHQQRWCDCLHRPRRLPGKPISHMSHKRSS